MCYLSKEAKKKCVFQISANIDFKSIFNVLTEYITGTKWEHNSYPLSIEISNFFIRPSNDSKFPIYVDIGATAAKTKSNSLTDRFKDGSIETYITKLQNNKCFVMGFAAKCSLVPLFTNLQATVQYAKNSVTNSHILSVKVENKDKSTGAFSFGNWVEVHFFEAYFQSNKTSKEMKFALSMRLFEEVSVAASLTFTDDEIIGSCRTGEISFRNIMKKALKIPEGSLILEIFGTIKLDWLKCTFWKKRNGTDPPEFELRCKPTLERKSSVAKFLKWMGMDITKLPLILKHNKGPLSVKNLAVELEGGKTKLAIDLSVLEIKEVGWFLEVTPEEFTGGASLKAIIHLFGKDLKVVGCIKGTVSKTNISISILASVEIQNGLNPFALIGLDAVKIITLDKILLAADMVLGTPVEGTVTIGLIGTFLGAKVTFVIVGDVLKFSPAGIFFRVENLSLDSILEAFGFKSVGLEIELESAEFSLATVKRTYKFECFDAKAVEDIENNLEANKDNDENEQKQEKNDVETKIPVVKRQEPQYQEIKFIQGCQIQAKINLFKLITMDADLRLHTDGFYFKLKVECSDDLRNAFKELMDKVKADLDEKAKAADEKLRRAEKEASDALKKARDRAPWLLKPFVWLGEKFVSATLLVARAACKVGCAMIKGLISAFSWVLSAIFSIIEPQLFQLILKADQGHFNVNFEAKIKFLKKITVNIKEDLPFKFDFSKLISIIFDGYKKGGDKYDKTIEDGANKKSQEAIDAARAQNKDKLEQMEKDYENMTEDEFKKKYQKDLDEMKEYEEKSKLDEIENEVEKELDNVEVETTPPPPDKNDEDEYEDKLADDEKEEEYKRKTNRIYEHYKNIFETEVFSKEKIRSLVEKYEGNEKKVMEELEQELTDEQLRQLRNIDKTLKDDHHDKHSEQLPHVLYAEAESNDQNNDNSNEENDEKLFEPEEKKEITETKGKKEDGISLYTLVNPGGSVVYYDGKDDDYDNKLKFIKAIIDKMNTNNEISAGEICKIFKDNSCDVETNDVYLIATGNISKHALKAILTDEKKIIDNIKMTETSDRIINGKDIMNRIVNKENKGKELNVILNTLSQLPNKQQEIGKLQFYQELFNKLNSTEDGFEISLTNLSQLMKQFGAAEINEEQLYCIDIRCDQPHFDISKILLSSIHDDVKRKSIQQDKKRQSINMKKLKILRFIENGVNEHKDIKNIFRDLRSKFLDINDVPKLQLCKYVFEKMNAKKIITTQQICDIFNKCQTDHNFNVKDDLFFYIYLKYIKQQRKRLKVILAELQQTNINNIEMDCESLLGQIMSNGLISILSIYEESQKEKVVIDFVKKRQFYQDIMQNKNDNGKDSVQLNDFCNAINRCAPKHAFDITEEKDEFFFVDLKKQTDNKTNFYEAMYGFYENPNFHLKTKFIIDLIFEPMYEKQTLQNIIHEMYEKALTNMESFDFTSKSNLYKKIRKYKTLHINAMTEILSSHSSHS
eukprot:259936_1